MKTIKFLLICIMLGSIKLSYSQQKKEPNKHIEINIGGRATLNIASQYPVAGFKFGINHVLYLTEKYSLHSGLSIVNNNKRSVYTAIGITIDNVFRRTGKSGLFLEQGLSAGYTGSRYKFDLFKVNNEGKVVNVGEKWIHSIVAGFVLGVGFDFKKVAKTDIQLYLRPGIFYQFPTFDNTFYFNTTSFEAGITWKPKF